MMINPVDGRNDGMRYPTWSWILHSTSSIVPETFAERNSSPWSCPVQARGSTQLLTQLIQMAQLIQLIQMAQLDVKSVDPASQWRAVFHPRLFGESWPGGWWRRCLHQCLDLDETSNPSSLIIVDHRWSSLIIVYPHPRAITVCVLSPSWFGYSILSGQPLMFQR